MNKAIQPLVLIGAIALALALSGCEVGGSCNPNGNEDCIAGNQNHNDNGGAIGDDNANDNNNASDNNANDNGADEPTLASYRYVMVLDREDPSTSSASSTAGADIDAVAVAKTDGSIQYATRVEVCTFGGGDNSGATDCSQALDVPESGCSPDAPDFVSLGGDGGTLVVGFASGVAMENGDVLIVYECGGDQNPGATDEDFDAYIGVSADTADANWVRCMADASGIAQCAIPNLPDVPID